MSDRRALPLYNGVALVVEGDGISIHATIAGHSVVLATVPLDALLRFLGPECGLVPADWENEGPSAKRKTLGPVAVGGPYDGKRIPKTAYPNRRIRVPLHDPGWMKPLDESIPMSASAFYREGEYELVTLRGSPMGEERELWWWKGELGPKPIADYGCRSTA